MVSERMQRQLDRLLDEAEVSVASRDWPAVAEHARAALAIDGNNADALTFLKMAEANGVSAEVVPPTDLSSPPRDPSIEQPSAAP